MWALGYLSSSFFFKKKKSFFHNKCTEKVQAEVDAIRLDVTAKYEFIQNMLLWLWCNCACYTVQKQIDVTELFKL